MIKQYYLGVFMFLVSLGSFSQDTISTESIDRALSYTYSKLVNERIFNLNTHIHWLKDSTGFWYVNYGKDKRDHILVKFDKLEKQPLFNAENLSKSLEKYFSEEFEAENLQLSQLEVLHDRIKFRLKGKKLEWNGKEISEIIKTKNTTTQRESISPDSTYSAFRKDYNLFVKNLKTGEEIQLTVNGKKDLEYASSYGWYDEMQGEGGERPENFSVRWSKDGKYLFTELVDTRNAQKMYLLDHTEDTSYRAKLYGYYRGSPGDTNMVKVTPFIFNMEELQKVAIDLPTETHINSVGIQFTEGEPDVAFAIIRDRGFKKQSVKKINLKTGEMKTVWEESSDTSIDNFNFRPIKDSDIAVVVSEKSGWKQLYLVNTISGKTKNLTNGEFVVNSISHIDDDSGYVYFLSSGVYPGMNPYHQQLFRIEENGKKQLITSEELHHQVNFSPDGNFFIDEISSVNIPTRTVLRNAENGKILMELTKADVSVIIAEKWNTPEVFSLVGKDKKSNIYGAFWKPTNFDPNKKYPIIDATYTGPHTQVFPKSFNRAIANQALAELGFVVVAVDGLGTAGRSKAFREVSYMNMGDNLRDHVLAIEFLGEKYKWIDTDKVGIFGHSAGGYDAAHALLEFPDFYKVGVSSAGDHDFRMEKAWWPEMYMGWPVDERYDEVSNIAMADQLKGKLLIVHGGMDNNVNPSATFRLAEELIKHGKDFDMYILPSQKHGFAGESLNFFQKKRWNYFIENLLGKQPRWDYNFE